MDTRYWQPPEWEAHQACWTAYPYDVALWHQDLQAAQDEFVAFCRAVAPGEPVHILVPGGEEQRLLQARLAGLPVRFFVEAYGDIWVRDTGPIFLRDGRGGAVAGCFEFNGWGHKYVMAGDSTVAGRVAQAAGTPIVRFAWVLEGGSIECDGDGTCLTSRQCLLNPNRNPNQSQAQIEAVLQKALGVRQVLWLDEGLHNDHTDGHIDTMARFVAPGVVVCMAPADADDPNGDILRRIADDLRGMRDAQGRALEVVQVASPGRVVGADGHLLPASYLNFYIGNKTVVVPTYGTAHDASAVRAIGRLFPTRQTVGLSARAILTGGGAFHCMTQQQPVGAIWSPLG